MQWRCRYYRAGDGDPRGKCQRVWLEMQLRFRWSDYMPVLIIYLKGLCWCMMTKYLHTWKPNTRCEQYLKRIKHMSIYLIILNMCMRTWVCHGQMLRRENGKMITKWKFLYKRLKVVLKIELMGSFTKKWKWKKGLRYEWWVHNAIPVLLTLWTIDR